MTDGPFRLDGKVALVTGAGQGIGRAIGMALAQAGAPVAITDVPSHHQDVDSLAAEIGKLKRRSRAYDLDVRKLRDIREAVNRTIADLGGLHIMVNNAGVRERKPSLEVREQDWDMILDINLKGLFFCAQAAAAHMSSHGGGSIINIASQLAVTAGPERAAYCASKGGVVSLTRSLALEWAKLGITVNAVGPGPTDTPMTWGASPKQEAMLVERSPIGRRLTPEEVAGAVVFLASPAASAITGQHLLVDGGWTAG